ncbi:MAG TPA: hypothetical protein VGM82_08335 [Gemmatimonadaceae bacterium]|jgi:hypothetical protein
MRSILIVPAAMLLAGCGAILHGSRQNIDVQASPSGAKVETSPTNGVYTTPTTLNLERKNSYVLTFTSPGYQPATFNLLSSVGTGIVIADVLLTGLIGVLVDGLTGAWYGLSPETANVTLTQNGGEDAASAIHLSVSQSALGLSVAGGSAEHPVTVTVRTARDAR